MLNSKARLKDFVFVICAYVGAFVFSYVVLSFFGLINVLPSSKNILYLDANWYSYIAEKGYQYSWYEASNSAFFPLFPYLWKCLSVGPLGISILNFCFAITGLFLLFRYYEITSLQLVVYLSLPSCIFFFLPFSESLFFFCGALFLIGLNKQKISWILLGIFLCSLTRATAMFFIPAFIVMELFYANTWFCKTAIKNILLYSGTSLIGLLLVVVFQYITTGVWFAFAKQQVHFWHHRFSMPHLPFITYGGDPILWLDGIALFFGFLATAVLMIFAIKFILKKESICFKDRSFWFSTVCCFMVTMYCIFFNYKGRDGSTELASLNRYLFASPFFLVFITKFWVYFNLSTKNILVFLATGAITWLTLGLGKPLGFLNNSYLLSLLFFLFLSAYTVFFLLVKNERYGKHAGTVLFCLHIFLSCITLMFYISNKWVA